MSIIDHAPKIRRPRRLCAAICIWAALAGAATHSVAAEFSVSPLHMDLQRPGSGAALTVANQGARPLRIELKLAEWSQDASGQDIYRASGAVDSLPRQVTIRPGESRVVNVDISTLAGRNERAYRLFLDEMPQTDAAGDFAISFALPIFFAPLDPDPRAEIEATEFEGGKLSITVANPGNRHIRIESLSASAGSGFAKEIAGWYLLAGARRVHTLSVPASVCGGLRRLDIRVLTEQHELKKSIAVEPGMCAH